MRTAAALALLLALLLAPQVALAQVERHTPGFPDVALRELLSELNLDPRLLEVLRRSLASAAVGGLSDAEIARAFSDALASGVSSGDLSNVLAALIELHGLSAAGEPIEPALLYELLSYIENEELAKELAALLESYAVGLATPEEVTSLLRKIESYYLPSGAVSPRDVLIATEVAQLVGRSLGHVEVGELAKSILEVMASEGLLTFDRAVTESVTRLLGLFRPQGGEPAWQLSSLVPDLGGQILPKSWTPSLGFSLPPLRIPHVDLSVLPYALIPVAAVACAIVLARAARAWPRIMWSVKAPRSALAEEADLRGLRAAIRNYWAAVRYLELRHGLVRNPWETHREYLSRVSIDNRRAFEGLTEAYEIAKYAQVESEDVDRASDAHLRELVGGSG